MCSEWSRFQKLSFGGRSFRPEDVIGDGNCFYRAAVRSGVLPIADHTALREAIFLFSIGVGRRVAEQTVHLLHQFSPQTENTFDGVINVLRKPGTFSSNIDMVLVSIKYDVDIIVYSNAPSGIATWSSLAFIKQHMPQFALSKSPLEIRIYHHLYLRPLSPAPSYQLNHFAILFDVTDSILPQAALAIMDAPITSNMATTINKKSLIQTTMADFIKPSSAGAKRKGVSVIGVKPKKLSQQKKLSVSAQMLHDTNLNVTAQWSTFLSVNKEAVARLDAARNQELQRRRDLVQRHAMCESTAIVESILTSILDCIETELTKTVIKLPTVSIPSRRKEMTWHARSLMIAFHLHPHLGGSNFDVFKNIFGLTVSPATLRDWLRKEKVYKWIEFVSNACKADIISIIPNDKKFIFDKGDGGDKISEKILSQYRQKETQAAASGKQLQLLLNDGVLSVQKASKLASKEKDSFLYVKKSTYRIPDSGPVKKLGAPIKHQEQSAWLAQLITDRFQRGDPMTRPEVYRAMRYRWNKEASESFRKIINDNSKLRIWVTRLLARINYSDRIGSISQKVPENWESIAKETTARIRERSVALNVDNVFNMDETFIVYYPTSEKLLVPKGLKRVGTLVPVNNDKKGVTLVVTSSLLSSQLLPPFIIDSGGFGSTLMHQWKNYSKSTVLFNPTHWMTQYIFILYLEWLTKMFHGQRLMLIVDRATTHYGEVIDNWLIANQNSDSPNKIYIEYIPEGMTSIIQVCDIAINKPLKEKIKLQYYTFRDQCIKEATAVTLTGTVFTVPRECLVEMIELAYDELNSANQKRRSIANAFAQCGQDPWAEDQSAFDRHLTGLKENTIYKHMAEATGSLTLK
jgi:hypothetical protein